MGDFHSNPLAGKRLAEADLLAILDQTGEEFAWHRIGAASHPNATESVLIKALHDNDVAVREAAIGHALATAAVVRTAATDRSHSIRCRSMAHRLAEKSALLQGVHDANVFVRQNAAMNHNADEEVLTHALAAGVSQMIVAKHPNATPALLLRCLHETMSPDYGPDATRAMHIAALRNANADEDVLGAGRALPWASSTAHTLIFNRALTCATTRDYAGMLKWSDLIEEDGNTMAFRESLRETLLDFSKSRTNRSGIWEDWHNKYADIADEALRYANKQGRLLAPKSPKL